MHPESDKQIKWKPKQNRYLYGLLCSNKREMRKREKEIEEERVSMYCLIWGRQNIWFFVCCYTFCRVDISRHIKCVWELDISAIIDAILTHFVLYRISSSHLQLNTIQKTPAKTTGSGLFLFWSKHESHFLQIFSWILSLSKCIKFNYNRRITNKNAISNLSELQKQRNFQMHEIIVRLSWKHWLHIEFTKLCSFVLNMLFRLLHFWPCTSNSIHSINYLWWVSSVCFSRSHSSLRPSPPRRWRRAFLPALKVH